MPTNPFQNIVTRNPLKRDGSYEWDWLVSGYFFFRLLTKPKILQDENPDAALMALCTGVTLPDINIATTERIGLGGTKVVVPTSLDHVTAFDFKFAEYIPGESTLPFLYLLSKWQNSIRNYLTGTADPEKAFSMNDYKSKAVMIGTDPSVKVITLALKFFGFMPVTIPFSGFNSEIATNEIVEYSIASTVDRVIPVDKNDSDVSSFMEQAKSYIRDQAVTVPETSSGSGNNLPTR